MLVQLASLHLHSEIVKSGEQVTTLLSEMERRPADEEAATSQEDVAEREQEEAAQVRLCKTCILVFTPTLAVFNACAQASAS